MSVNSPTDGKENQAAQGITAISVQGFKSLYNETRVEVRPLTILAGANSSGKSSIMQPLLLLKQTLEATYDPGPLLLDGPNVHLGAVDQFLSRLSPEGASASLLLTLEVGEIGQLTSIFTKKQDSGFALAATTYDGGETTYSLWPGMQHNDILAVISPDIDEVRRAALSIEGKSSEWGVVRFRCFLGIGLHPVAEQADRWIMVHLPQTSAFEVHVRRLIHIPGLRGNPERTYRTTATGPEFPGTFEHYVASVIHHWQQREDPRWRELSRALQTLGLTWKVEARLLDDTRVELRIGRLPRSARGGARDLVSIADVGFGVSQVLPVLVALLAAEPGQLVYLEQPEIHLHPRAQAALAQVLADAAIRGVRVVAETHSAVLLLAVQALVAEGKLPPGLVKLHWFERGQDGATKITSADLDEAGAFGEDWPEDFADVSLELQSRYLDAAEAHWEAR